MSQAITWSVPLSGPVSPDVFAQRIDESFDAALSSHSGSSRPTYAVAGTIWISTATAGKLKKYLFDGTNDRLLETIDIATGAISYEPGTMTGPVNYANFAITNPAGKWLKGYISPGFNLANNATDPTNNLDFPAGVVASDETTPILMEHSAGTAQLNVVYGTGNGGRFSSAAISDGTWHCFVISNGTTVSRGFSKNLDPTADSNYPAGFTHYKRVLSILRESGSIVLFEQKEDLVRRGAVSVRSSTAAAADVLLTMQVPVGIEVFPILRSALRVNTSSNISNSIGSGYQSSAPYVYQQEIGTSAAATTDSQMIPPVWVTNLSAQLRYSATINSGSIISNDLQLYGWIDPRGRS